MENQGKGKGGGEGGGWGRDRQRNRQVNAQALSKLPFSDLPLKKCPIYDGNTRHRYIVATSPSQPPPFSGLPRYPQWSAVPLCTRMTCARLRWAVMPSTIPSYCCGCWPCLESWGRLTLAFPWMLCWRILHAKSSEPSSISVAPYHAIISPLSPIPCSTLSVGLERTPKQARYALLVLSLIRICLCNTPVLRCYRYKHREISTVSLQGLDVCNFVLSESIVLPLTPRSLSIVFRLGRIVVKLYQLPLSNQIQWSLLCLNESESVWISLCKSKRQNRVNFLTTGNWGKTTLNLQIRWYTYIYIYFFFLGGGGGSITWPYFSHFWVNNLATFF